MRLTKTKKLQLGESHTNLFFFFKNAWLLACRHYLAMQNGKEGKKQTNKKVLVSYLQYCKYYLKERLPFFTLASK